ncbi:MAG: hypothetical protein KC496_09755 [Anaerolineae bacterium]|nr:hypothetical protein [Anaerolineae bacterium]
MTHLPLPHQLSFEEPVVLLHSDGLLHGASYSLDDLFINTQQWTQSGLPPQGLYIKVIRRMRNIAALLRELHTYRLGIIVSHPVDYVRELYRYASGTVSHPLHILASEHSLDDFTSQEQVIDSTTNPFTRALSGSEADSEAELRAAQHRVQAAGFVATSDMPVEMMLVLMYWLDMRQDWEQVVSLRPPAGPELSEEVRATVIARSALDVALYEQAQKRFQQHYQQMIVQSLQTNRDQAAQIKRMEAQIKRLHNELSHQAKTNARRAQLIRDFIRKA